MDREQVKNKIIEIIKTNLPEFASSDIKEDTRINTAQGLDSMTFIYVMCKIEAAFEIKIKESKWDKMFTLKDILDEVMLQLSKKKVSA